MKKLKKLLSVALAGAMALSLCVTALATTTTPTTAFPNTGNVGGTIDATSLTQGEIPARPISIILPTVDTRASGTPQLFDFYLDPHNLIVQTNAAKYKPTTGDAPTFDPATKLYFASETGADYTYSGTSKALKVINTGYVPLDVDLDLKFSRGGADFDLVDSADSLDVDPGARPEMYLAVAGTGLEEPEAVTDPASWVPTLEISSDPSYLATGASVTAPAFAYTDFDDTGDMPEEDFDTLVENLRTALANANVTLTFTPADEDADTDANIVVALTLNGFTVEVTDGTNEIDEGTIDADTNVVITISGTDSDSNTAELATISFSVAMPTDDDAEEGEQTIGFDVPFTGAKVETALDILEDSYVLSYTDDATAKTALEASNVEVTDSGYYWEKKVTDNSAYPSFTFNLVGNINEANEDEDSDVSPWDVIVNDTTSGNTGVRFDLIWTVSLYDKDQGRDKIAAGAGGGGQQSQQPTVVVDTPATGTAASTKTATLTWTAGTGDYENYAPVSAKNSKGTFTSGTLFKVTGNTINLVANTTLKTDPDCVITFSDGTDSIDVAVTGWFG